jgi:hypothetical protein
MSGRRISGIAVVTGGASGIGAACCRVLAEAGATVAVLDRDEARAQAVAAEVKGRAWVADVGDEKALDECAGAIETAVGPVDVLVNSAGVLQQPLPPEQLPMSAWDNVIHIDQRGTYVASVAFGRAADVKYPGRGLRAVHALGRVCVPPCSPRRETTMAQIILAHLILNWQSPRRRRSRSTRIRSADVHRDGPCTPQCRPACRRPAKPAGRHAGCATCAALLVPALWRSHDRHRGLRARLRAEVATDTEQDRLVMSQTFCERCA